jgi:hypothetical protein
VAHELGLGDVVAFGCAQQWARLADEQLVVPFDRQDVGMLGDRPEWSIRPIVNPRNGIVRPQMGERRPQPLIVGVGRRIGRTLAASSIVGVLIKAPHRVGWT